MLKKENEDKNNDYNYRLISNIFLNDNNFNSKNDNYIYLFGLFPCKYIPSAYIPFNYKKLLQNINRINPKKNIPFENIFNEKNIAEQLKKKIENFLNENATYNKLNLYQFAIILIFYWSIILLLINYIFLYYYRSIFNYILAAILFVLLLFSVVWKMIYTIQN